MIELSPGQEMPLVDETGEQLTTLRMGVGWDHAPTAGFIGTGAPEIDLDASAVQFGDGQAFDFAFYNNLSTRDGSVVHQGDNKSGRGEGDDEEITVDLTKVHRQIDSIVFLVSSYQGHTLEWINNAYCRLVDDRDVELARFTLSLGVPETGLAMATISRDGNGWKLRAIGEGIKVKVPTESVKRCCAGSSDMPLPGSPACSPAAARRVHGRGRGTGRRAPGADAALAHGASGEHRSHQPQHVAPESSPPPRPVSPDDARIGIAIDAIDHLAGRIGPRPGTSAAYFRAADWVEEQFRGSGWEVRRHGFPTPAGVSWGVPVPGGRRSTWSLPAATYGPASPGCSSARTSTRCRRPRRRGQRIRRRRPAHPRRRARRPPLAAARDAGRLRLGGAARADRRRPPLRVACVRRFPHPAQRGSLRGMVSMDRVGVGSTLPIGSTAQPSWLRAELVRAAERAGVDYVAETGQRSSDHWSFVREGMPGVRLGSTPYAGYHCPATCPR